MEKHPELLDRAAEPGLLLSAVSEVDLAVTLHEQGLLPETHRRKFVETVTGYALNGDDLEALGNQGIRSVFNGGEFEDFRQQVRTKLVPRLDDVRRDWLSNRGSDDSPEDFAQPLKDWLKSLADEFADDDKVKGIVKRECTYIDEWIAEHSDEEQQDRPTRTLGAVETPEEFDDARSIFDDVDA